MNIKHISSVTFVLFLTIQFLLFSTNVEAQDYRLAELHGKVINVVGLPIPNVEIELESDVSYQKIKTDANGNYQLKLHPTFYIIRLNEWIGKLPYPKDEIFYTDDCNSYFRKAYRSAFQLQRGESSEINFVLAEAECVAWNSGDKTSPNLGTMNAPTDIGTNQRTRYDTLFTPKEEFTDTFDLMVQYGHREERNNTITYKPTTGYRFYSDELPSYVFGNPFPGVIVTYNLMTIYMSKATFDKKRRTLTSEGKIIVEDGKKQYEARKVLINIGDGKVYFNISAKS